MSNSSQKPIPFADGFQLFDEVRNQIARLFLQGDTLCLEPGTEDVFAGIVARLNAIKRRILWADEPWETLLATAAQVPDFDDYVCVQAPANVEPRQRVTEFSRRMALIERLLPTKSGVAITRERLLASMTAELTLWSEKAVYGWFEEQASSKHHKGVTAAQGWDDELDQIPLPTIAGLSGPSLSTDVKAMRELGFGFDPRPERVSRQPYRLDTARLPLWVGVEEATALRNACNLLREMNIAEADVLQKMLKRVPDAIQEGMDIWDMERALVGAGDRVDPEVYHLVREALKTEVRGMKIRYRSVGSNSPKIYYVENPTLNWFEGHMYLVGHCPREQGGNMFEKNREFRLDRFVNADGNAPVEVIDTTPRYAKLPHFTLRFRAKPDLAARLRTGPDGFKVHRADADGNCLVDVEEFTKLRAVRRLLSYGTRITPISPDFVVKEYYDTVATIAAQAPKQS